MILSWPDLVLKEDEAFPSKECGQAPGAAVGPQLTVSKDMRIYVLESQEPKLANKLNELGSRFLPRASRKKHSQHLDFSL